MLRKPVGERIRYARLAADKTQQELADEIGTERVHVNKWENGKYPPSFEYRQRLAEATGFPIEFFRHPGRGGSDE